MNRYYIIAEQRMNFARMNFGIYPTHIMMHPIWLEKFIEETPRHSNAVTRDSKVIEIMGMRVLRSLDMGELETPIVAATKYRNY
jgi:hypothetical protein